MSLPVPVPKTYSRASHSSASCASMYMWAAVWLSSAGGVKTVRGTNPTGSAVNMTGHKWNYATTILFQTSQQCCWYTCWIVLIHVDTYPVSLGLMLQIQRPGSIFRPSWDPHTTFSGRLWGHCSSAPQTKCGKVEMARKGAGRMWSIWCIYIDVL